jgi:hypothetical protein
MANTFELIASSTVGSGGASSIAFSSIPSTYTDLKLVICAAFSTSPFGGGSTWYELNINGNGVGTNITGRMVYTDGTPYSNTSNVGGYAPDSSNTNAPYSFSNSELYFPNYASSNAKSFSAESVAEANTSNTKITMHANLWSPGTQTAITSIALTGRSSATFAQYSTAYLYGIKNS